MWKRTTRTRGVVETIEVPVGRITGIVASARAPGRFDLLIEGQSVARLGIEGIERLGLRTGLDIDQRQAAAIGEEAAVSRAYDRAMMMLAARGRASGELRRLLVQKGEAAAAVDLAVRRLADAGFVDDAQFAKSYARAKGATGVSRRRIEQELGRKGVDRSILVDAIDEVFAEEQIDEATAIERAAEKKLRTLGRVDDETRRRRLYGYLARRGFDADQVSAIVGRLLKQA
jgi:regulatory protein